MKFKVTDSHGNTIYVVLLALILCAALFVYVYRTTIFEGYYKIKREQAVSNMMSHISEIAGFVNNSFLNNDYDQITNSNDSFLDDIETIAPQEGGGFIKSGKTLGLYAVDTGIKNVPPDLILLKEGEKDAFFNYGIWLNAPLKVNGKEIGTELGDYVLTLGKLSKSACIAINQNIYGEDSTDIPLAKIENAGTDRSYSVIHRENFSNIGMSTPDALHQLELLPGCHLINSAPFAPFSTKPEYVFFYLLKSF